MLVLVEERGDAVDVPGVDAYVARCRGGDCGLATWAGGVGGLWGCGGG